MYRSEELLEQIKGDNIIVNCALGAALQDLPGFTREPAQKLSDKPEKYLIGKINSTQIWVDPGMQFHDLRILNNEGVVLKNLSPTYTPMDFV